MAHTIQARSVHEYGSTVAVGIGLVTCLSCSLPPEPTESQPLVPERQRLELVADALVRADRSITAGHLRRHMTVLADDAMEGRETGTPGFDLAAAYVADQFLTLGLKPVRGSFLQQMTIRRAKPIEEETTLEVAIGGESEPLVYGRDFVMYGVPGTSIGDIQGRILFVGDGVVMPDRGLDAYKGLEVSGDVGVALHGAPASLTASERSYYGGVGQKSENGAARGLGALLLIDDSNIPWELRVSSARQLGVNEALATEETATAPVVFLSEEGAKKVFGSLDAASFKVGAVLGEARLRFRQTSRQVQSANVIAVWPGSDDVGSREHVVIMAHLDHIGIGVPVDGDPIHNGAVDNASGVAALITIADAFASLPARTARSIVFLATTGEEQGLVGSSYFIRHPPFPIESIVAALNIDGTSITPFEELDIRGGSISSLGTVAEAAAARLRFRVRLGPLGIGGSDHSPFLLAGVPPLWIGAALPDDWMGTRYHTPQDDMKQPLDLAAAARYTQFAFVTAYLTANTSDRPTWNAGEFFGTLRAQ